MTSDEKLAAILSLKAEMEPLKVRYRALNTAKGIAARTFYDSGTADDRAAYHAAKTALDEVDAKITELTGKILSL